MDKDLEQMSREKLIEEIKKLRNGIRRHRDSKYRQSLDKQAPEAPRTDDPYLQ